MLIGTTGDVFTSFDLESQEVLSDSSVFVVTYLYTTQTCIFY